MRIENELKLDYSDVLLRPKRSTLGSRKDVSLMREFAKLRWSGLPVMAANMDGVGTFEMATELAKQKMFTCLKKTYDTTQLIEFFSNKLNCQHTAMSIGITDYDFRKFCDVYSICQNLKFVCIDVANGYSERFVDFIKKIREVDSQGIYDAKANDTFRRHNPLFIIAGNVVTGEMTEQLILNGVDIVKVGIGPGCFLPETIVNTTNGSKPIEKIQVGDIVKTHTGAEKPVIDTLVYDNTKPIVSINGIKSTDSHEYYVLHKKYKDKVTDENVHDLAEWIEAKNLTKDYLLLKHKC